MNTIYRIVWNVTLGKWVVASELAKGRKKKSSLKTAMLSLAVVGAMAGMGVPSVYAADVTMPSCVAGEDPHETGCVPTSEEQLMTPFYAVGGADDKGDATNTAVGQGAVAGIDSATNARATAMGFGARALATNATAVGNGSYAATSDSVAMGSGARAGIDAGGVVSGKYQTAVGFGASAVASSGTALGQEASATGATGSTAVGWAAKANASATGGAWSATAVGTHAVADGDGAAALGDSAQARGAATTAFGRDAKATFSDGTAFGAGTNVGAAGGTAIGSGSKVNGVNGAAIGKTAIAGGSDSVAIGTTALTTDSDSIAMGNTANASQGAVAIGATAKATNTGAVALGHGASATTGSSVAIGYNASVTNGAYSNALGAQAKATSNNSNAVGNSALASAVGTNAFGNAAEARAQEAVAIGHVAKTDAEKSVVIGSGATLSASATGSVALGAGATTDRANAVAVGNGVASNRQIVNLAAGTQDTDAVNLSQLKNTAGTVAAALGGGVTVNPDGTITKPSYTVQGTPHDNVGSALGAVDSSLTSIGTRVTKNEGDIVTIGGRVTGAETSITNLDGRVTKNEGDILTLQNNLGAATRYFKADGLNDGSDDASASGARAVAMGASSAATSAQSIAIGFGANAGASEGAIAIGASSRATGENSVALGSGSIAGRDNVVSVGAGPSIGNGTRQIINVTNGTENTDAVNVQQLKPAIAALGGGATFNANGTVTGPQYIVTDVATGDSTPVDNVGDALGRLNANTLNLDGRVTTNETDIGDIRNRLGSGSIGLVQQSDPNAAVTVAAATGGKVVDLTGTAGARQLKGVSAGEDETDAVNVAQLRDEIGKASAGDTRYFKADGAMDGSDDAINTGSRSVAIGAGSQATAGNAVALGAGSVADRADTVSVGSKGNERQIVNVAEGTDDTDAVNVAQLKKAGLVGGDGSTLDAVVYDLGSSRGSVTFGGTGGTLLTNVKAGLVSGTSTDAVNGSQLWILQDQVVKLGDRVTNVENGAPASVPVTPSPAPGEARDPAFAATGDGGPASAAGKDSVAVGTGASAKAENSVALGAGSVADRADTVSVGSAGHERVVSNVAAGTQRTDAANWGQVQDALATANRYTDDRFDGVNRRIGEVQRQANRGIAASAALINVTPYMPGKTVLNAGVANYRGESALGVGVSRWNDSGRVNFNAGMSAAAGDSPIFRMGVGVVLGD